MKIKPKNLASWLGKRWLLVLVVLLVVVVLAEIVIIFGPDLNQFGKKSIREYALQVVEACADDSFRPGCYDEEIPELIGRLSMEEAFEVARVVQREDPEYGYCHVLGHNLSAKETAKDPDKWREVISRCPVGICSNGCLHGAAQERFRDNVLDKEQLETAKQELIGTCEDREGKTFSGLERAECYHGLGHLSMYLTGADLQQSVEICDVIAIDKDHGDFTDLCYGGLFMQLFQPLDEEDTALIAGKGPETPDEARPFSESFEDTDVEEACWGQAIALFRSGFSDPDKILEVCGQSSTEDAKEYCYSMAFYGEAQGANYDAATLTKLCEGLPSHLQAFCFGDMSNAIIHGSFENIERAVDFCSNASDPEVEQGCYERILEYSNFNILPGTEHFNRLCQALPEGELTESCLSITR